MNDPPHRILVICTGNRARSQMAHGWLRHLGGGRVAVKSAGTVPKGVHPVAIQVMAEVGIDISGHTSDHVDEYVAEEFDLVLTVCDQAKQACPVFPGATRTLHHAFEDPDYPWMSEEAFTDVFRRIRDEIGVFCRELLARSTFHGTNLQPVESREQNRRGDACRRPCRMHRLPRQRDGTSPSPTVPLFLARPRLWGAQTDK